jgi:hypothetical protein
MTRNADNQTTRELAQRLLSYEAVDGAAVEPEKLAVYQVCDKLRRPLTLLAGAGGFRSLLTRALTLAKQESPHLKAWDIKADGSLQGLNGEAVQLGPVLIAHLIGLMMTFIGESLTLRLLHDVWPALPEFEANLKGFNRNE